MMKVYDRRRGRYEDPTGSRTATAIARLVAMAKLWARLAYKLIRSSRHDPPTRVRSFQRFYTTDLNSSGSPLNFFERLTFELPLAAAALVQYHVPSEGEDTELLVEGEAEIPYRRPGPWIHPTPSIRLHSLEDGGIYGYEGAVFSRTGRAFVAETVRPWFSWDRGDRLWLISRTCSGAPRKLTGVALCLAKQGGYGYYHFLVECLPKLTMLKDAYPSLKLDWVVVSGPRTRFKEELLGRIGVEAGQIIPINQCEQIYCEQLIFISDVMHQYAPNPTALASLRNALGVSGNEVRATPTRRPRIILASREDVPHRRFSFEHTLKREFDVEDVMFSRISIQDAIKKCQSADILVGGHGAALANAVFFRPGTAMVEVCTNINYLLYGRLAANCGMHHLTADDSDPESVILAVQRAVKEMRTEARTGR